MEPFHFNFYETIVPEKHDKFMVNSNLNFIFLSFLLINMQMQPVKTIFFQITLQS